MGWVTFKKCTFVSYDSEGQEGRDQGTGDVMCDERPLPGS